MQITQIKCYLLTFFASIVFHCQAQNPYEAREATIARRLSEEDSIKRAKFNISGNIGFSNGLGTYGVSISGANSGLANPNPPIGGAGIGINYNLVAGLDGPHQNIEYQMMLMHTANAIDLSTYLYSATGGGWNGNTYSNYQTPAMRFEFTSAMAGIARTFKNEYISFDMRFLLGYMYGGIPEFRCYQNNIWWNPQIRDIMTIGSLNYYAVATDLGIGFKIFAWGQTYIAANVDLFWVWDNSGRYYDIPVSFSAPANVSSANQIADTYFKYQVPPPFMVNASLGFGYTLSYYKNK